MFLFFGVFFLPLFVCLSSFIINVPQTLSNVFVVKDIFVIFRKIKSILILMSVKRYFSHPENSILNLSLP